MEDTQDKVRRNLVVFSAAIVIGWFLDLKVTVITKLFVSASDLDNVNVGKLWIVAFLVLVYLFLRYRFDSFTNSQMVNLLGELKKQRRNYLSKYLLRKIAQINQTGKFPPIFDASLMEGVNREIEKYEKEHSQKILFRLHFSNPWSNQSPIDFGESEPLWKGTVGIGEEYFKVGSSRNLVISSGQRHDFLIPLNGRIWITTHSIIHAISYSKSAVDLIVPIILAGLASLITICKLIAILFELVKI